MFYAGAMLDVAPASCLDGDNPLLCAADVARGVTRAQARAIAPAMKHALSVTRAQDFAAWYQEVISEAEMAARVDAMLKGSPGGA